MMLYDPRQLKQTSRIIISHTCFSAAYGNTIFLLNEKIVACNCGNF